MKDSEWAILDQETTRDGDETELAFALKMMSEQGCYCDNENGICLGCACERALRAERSARNDARDALRDLLEYALDMRGYCRDWDYKYGQEWDEAIARARKALEGE